MGEISNAAVVFLGVGTVFVGLIGLVVCCKIMGYVLSRMQLTRPAEKAPAARSIPAAAEAVPGTPAEESYAEPVPETGGMGMELAVSAALAEMLGVDISDIRIRSIRRVDGNTDDIPNRQQLIAAISVAIAEMLGTDVSAIRIHSFRKV